MPVKFIITAAHTSPILAGERTTLYYGEKKTAAAARRHAEATVERLKRKHTGSFADYRIEPSK